MFCREYRVYGLRLSQNLGYFFGGPFNKGYSISGSILGSPNLGKLRYLQVKTTGDGGMKRRR